MDHDQKGKILFVDNDPDTCELVSTLLETSGYQVTIAINIIEAFHCTQNQNFDLILLDLYLEDGTGIDICRGVRDHDKQTPIFFYTGVAYPQELKKALEAGAQGFFINPVECVSLLRTIEAQVKG